ncbi:MAG: (d)CMP kinase [Pseudomonadota bacterium]
MRHYPAIAIDGPAASGKSTLGRMVSAALGLRFLDTGLLYRAIAKEMLEAGTDLGDVEAAVAAAKRLNAAHLDAEALKTEAIGKAASTVAPLVPLREALLTYQRDFAGTAPGAVLAGRDIGTIVLPDADFKLFITASAEARANRRFEELRAGGFNPILSEVLEDIEKRDRRDQARAVAPLRAASDAFTLDTSDLARDAACQAALRAIERESGLSPVDPSGHKD